VINMPTLVMICVKAPKNPLLFGGAVSLMYKGTITTAAPAPRPDTKRPKVMMPMLGARASSIGPAMKKAVLYSMVGRRPYFEPIGPAARAPSRPPRVKKELTRPNCSGFIGMHCGSVTKEEAVYSS
jgi:hypothetical protein